MQPTRLLSIAAPKAASQYSSRLVRRVAIVSALATAAATAACSDSDSPTAPTSTQVAGAYPMATVRGMSVPHTFTDAVGKKLTIEGGSLTIEANGTYELKYKGKLNSLTFDLTDEGNYTLSGSTMSFTPDDGDPAYTGRVQGKAVFVDGFKIAGAKFDLSFSGK